MKNIQMKKMVVALILALAMAGSTFAFAGCSKKDSGRSDKKSSRDADDDEDEDEDEDDEKEDKKKDKDEKKDKDKEKDKDEDEEEETEATTEETTEETEDSDIGDEIDESDVEDLMGDLNQDINIDDFKTDKIRDYIKENQNDSNITMFPLYTANDTADIGVGLEEGIVVIDNKAYKETMLLKFESVDNAKSFIKEMIEGEEIEYIDNSDGTTSFETVMIESGMTMGIVGTIEDDGFLILTFGIDY